MKDLILFHWKDGVGPTGIVTGVWPPSCRQKLTNNRSHSLLDLAVAKLPWQFSPACNHHQTGVSGASLSWGKMATLEWQPHGSQRINTVNTRSSYQLTSSHHNILHFFRLPTADSDAACSRHCSVLVSGNCSAKTEMGLSKVENCIILRHFDQTWYFWVLFLFRQTQMKGTFSTQIAQYTRCRQIDR